MSLRGKKIKERKDNNSIKMEFHILNSEWPKEFTENTKTAFLRLVPAGNSSKAQCGFRFANLSRAILCLSRYRAFSF